MTRCIAVLMPPANCAGICGPGRRLEAETLLNVGNCLCIDEILVAGPPNYISDVATMLEGRTYARLTFSSDKAFFTEKEILCREFECIGIIHTEQRYLNPVCLDHAFEQVLSGSVDCVLSAINKAVSAWNIVDGSYDVVALPKPDLCRSNLFTVVSRKHYEKMRFTPSGRIGVIDVEDGVLYKVSDLATSKRMKPRPMGIKVFLTDCDGCLTDGGMYYSESGDELKKFNTKDGMGFSLLRSAGIMCGIVTGEDKQLNKRRSEKLKIDFCIQGCHDKLGAVKKLCFDNGFSLDEVLYVGDDLNDLALIKSVGFSCCPADAMTVIKEEVDYVAAKNGGAGVIREVVDLLLGSSSLPIDFRQ